MAQITFVNKNSASTTGATSLAVTKPASLAAGDVMVATIFIESTSDLINSVPTGWGAAVINSISGTRVIRQYVYVKVATGSEDASYSWGFSSSVEAVAIISAYRGVNNSTPYGNTRTSTSTSSSVNTTAPTLTVQNAGNKVVWMGGNCYGTTYTPPTNYSERDDVRSGTGSTNLSGSMADYDPAAGATGNITGVAANADYFHASAIELIAARITGAGGIASAEVFGTLLLAGFLLLTGIGSGEAVGGAFKVRNPADKALCGAIATGEAFGSPTIQGMAPTIISTAGDINSGEALGTPALKGKILAAGGVASGEAFGTATAGQTQILAAGGIAGAEEFGTAKLTGNRRCGDIASAEGFGMPLVHGVTSVLIMGAGGIPSGEAAGTAQLNGQVAAAGGIAGEEAFGTTSVGVKRLCGAIPSGETFGTPALGSPGPRIYAAGAIASAEALGTPALKGVVYAAGIPSAEEFGILWTYRIDFCGNIPSEEAFGTPALSSGGASQIRVDAGIASLEAVPGPRLRGRVTTGVIATGFAAGDARIKGTIEGAGGITTFEAITDGGFECWLSPTEPEHWTVIASGNSTANREDVDIHGGRHCMRLDIGSSGTVDLARAFTMPTSVRRVLSVWYKTAPGKSARLLLYSSDLTRYLATDGTWSAFSESHYLTSGGAWAHYVLPFTSHPTKTDFIINLTESGAAGSSIHIDDVSIDAESDPVGSPRLGGHVQSIAGIGTAEAFGAPNVNDVVAGAIVGTGHVASEEAFGAAALRGTIVAEGIATGEDVGVPDVMGGKIRPGGIPSEEAFGEGAIGWAILDAGAIASGETFGMARVHALSVVSGKHFCKVRPTRRLVHIKAIDRMK